MVPCFPLLGLTPSGLFMGLSSTSELILCSIVCVPSATRHNIHDYNSVDPCWQIPVPDRLPSLCHNFGCEYPEVSGGLSYSQTAKPWHFNEDVDEHHLLPRGGYLTKFNTRRLCTEVLPMPFIYYFGKKVPLLYTFY